MVLNSNNKTSWSRVAYCFGIGLCIQVGLWLLWLHPSSSRLAALVALLALCIGIIITHRGAPIRFFMVSLHLELQAAALGFTVGHQLFDVYPQWAIWSGAIGNVTNGIIIAIVLGMLGTAGLRMTQGRKPRNDKEPRQQSSASTGAGV